MYQFLFSVMSYFIRNLDKMLIGKYIGMAPLGYYEKSYRLMSLPIQNITYVITPVLHPILSDYQKEEKRLELYFHKRLMNDTLPLSIGGGIGQSRLCMFYLRKAHIGEIQASIWPEDMRKECEELEIHLI